MFTKLRFIDTEKEVKDERSKKNEITYFMTMLFIYISTDRFCLFFVFFCNDLSLFNLTNWKKIQILFLLVIT